MVPKWGQAPGQGILCGNGTVCAEAYVKFGSVHQKALPDPCTGATGDADTDRENFFMVSGCKHTG